MVVIHCLAVMSIFPTVYFTVVYGSLYLLYNSHFTDFNNLRYKVRIERYKIWNCEK